jgi:hypothetical protein
MRVNPFERRWNPVIVTTTRDGTHIVEPNDAFLAQFMVDRVEPPLRNTFGSS